MSVTYIYKPSEYSSDGTYGSNSTDSSIERLYDGNEIGTSTTYVNNSAVSPRTIYVRGAKYATGHFIDARQVIIDDIKKGHSITSFKVYIVGRAYSSTSASSAIVSLRLTGTTGESTVTSDYGDGSVPSSEAITSTTSKTVYFSFPQAVKKFNENPDLLKEFWCRIYSGYSMLYDMWYEVEVDGSPSLLYRYKPSSYSNVGSTHFTNPASAYNGTSIKDSSSYSYWSSYSNESVQHFNGAGDISGNPENTRSVIAGLINAGYGIKNFRVHAYVRSYDSGNYKHTRIKVQLTKELESFSLESTSSGDKNVLDTVTTDLGDGIVSPSSAVTTTSLTSVYFSFPNAAKAINKNPELLSTFYTRIIGKYLRLYDLWYEFELGELSYSVNFVDEYPSYNLIDSKTVVGGNPIGTIPDAPTRKGYEFLGWYPSKPVCDTKIYNKSANDTIVLDNAEKSHYKYTDKISCHFEGYIGDWNKFKNMQFLSCTDGGGWAVGTYASANSGKICGIEMGFDQGSENKYSYVSLGIESSSLNSLNNDTSKNWHSFDFTFNNGVLSGWKDGEKKTTTYNTSYLKSAINYKSTNRIIVGGEAGTGVSGDYTESNKLSYLQDGYYLQGAMSTVFIENTGDKLEKISESTTIEDDVTYYAAWRTDVNRTMSSTTTGNGIGTVSFSGGNSARLYQEKTVTFAPSEGSYVKSATATTNGNTTTLSVSNNSSSFTVLGDTTINVEFALVQHTVSINGNATNTSSVTKDYGTTNLTITLNAYNNYDTVKSFSVVKSNGEVLTQNTDYTVSNSFNSTSHYYIRKVTIKKLTYDCTINIEFERSTNVATFIDTYKGTRNTVSKLNGDALTLDTCESYQTVSTVYTFSGWRNTTTNTLHSSGENVGSFYNSTTYQAEYTESVRKYSVNTQIISIRINGNEDVIYNVTEQKDYGTNLSASTISLPLDSHNFEYSKDQSGTTYGYTENCTVDKDTVFTVYLRKKTYAITTEAEGNGTITETKTLEYGDDITITAIPDDSADYVITRFVIDGNEETTNKDKSKSYTFSNITENHSVFVKFVRRYTLTISTSNLDDNCIVPSSVQFLEGEIPDNLRFVGKQFYDKILIRFIGSNGSEISSDKYDYKDATFENHIWTVEFGFNEVNDDVNIYIDFDRSTFTATFYGVDNPVQLERLYGQTFTYKKTRTKSPSVDTVYTFAGWQIDSNKDGIGDGEVITDNENFAIYKNTDFYPYFTESPREYTITIITPKVENGQVTGSNTDVFNTYYETSVDLNNYNNLPESHEFNRWEDNNGDTYESDYVYSTTDSLTFTAYWDIKTFGATINTKGSGTVTSNIRKAEWGSDWTVSINPYKTEIQKVVIQRNGVETDVTSQLISVENSKSKLLTINEVKEPINITIWFVSFKITDVYFEFNGRRFSELEQGVKYNIVPTVFLKAKVVGIE